MDILHTLQICAWIIPWKVVFLKYRKKLYFLKYFYTGWNVRTSVCMILKNYFHKYNWKYHLSAVLGTVINAQRTLEVHGKHYTTKSCIFLQSIFAMYFVHMTWRGFFLRTTYLTILVHVVIEWPLQWNFSCAENVVVIYKQINTINLLEENYAFFINTLLQFCTIPSVQSSSKAYWSFLTFWYCKNLDSLIGRMYTKVLLDIHHNYFRVISTALQ